jgi:hypothetical protein
VAADVDIRTPELHLGSLVMKEQNGAVHASAFGTPLLVATSVQTSTLVIAGTQFVPGEYATMADVTAELVDTLVNHQPYSHITEVPGAVIIDEHLEVPSVDIGSVELRIVDSNLVVNSMVDVSALRIDGVEFDMVGHSTQVDQHSNFFQDVSIAGEDTFRTFEYDVCQSIKTVENDVNPGHTVPHPGVLRVNKHFTVGEPGRAHTEYAGLVGVMTERPGLVCINAPWIEDPSGTQNRDNQIFFDNSVGLADNKLWLYDPLVIRSNYSYGADGEPYTMNDIAGSPNRGISFRQAPMIPGYGLGPKETTHIGPNYSVFGSSLDDAVTHSTMSKPMALTVGSTADFAADKNVYQMCVRGKILCKTVNSGYSNYTLFHAIE